MAAPPFVQFYVADFLADTQHLTTEEIGAYLLILMTMWRSGGALPSDQKILARCARLAGRRWADAWERIGPLFTVSGGVVTQKRLAEEYAKAMQKSAARAASGAKGGSAKALKDNNTVLANGPVLPQHLLQTPDTRKKKPVSPPSQPIQASLLADASEMISQQKTKEAEFGAFYAAFPRHIARGAAETAYWRARKSASAEVLLAGAQAYATQRKGEDDKFTKYPATWLNGKCWLDGEAGQKGAGEMVPTDLWVWRLETFHHGQPETDEEAAIRAGHWQASWGPEPGKAGCLVPAEAIESYRRRRPPAAAVGAA